jgi:hypothetical protein
LPIEWVELLRLVSVALRVEAVRLVYWVLVAPLDLVLLRELRALVAPLDLVLLRELKEQVEPFV